MFLKPTTTFFNSIKIKDITDMETNIFSELELDFNIYQNISDSFRDSNIAHELIIKELLFAILIELLSNVKTRELLDKNDFNRLTGTIVCTTLWGSSILLSIPPFILDSDIFITGDGYNLTRENFDKYIWDREVDSQDIQLRSRDGYSYYSHLADEGYTNITLASAVNYKNEIMNVRLNYKTVWFSVDPYVS